MPTLQAWKGDAMAKKLRETPLLDELEKGPWPSFVTEMKKSAAKNVMANDQLGLLERSYADKIGHWKHGGIVGVIAANIMFDLDAVNWSTKDRSGLDLAFAESVATLGLLLVVALVAGGLAGRG